MKDGWTNYLTSNVVLFIFALYLALYAVFGFKLYGIEWMGAAFLIFIFIVRGSNYFPRIWSNISERSFSTKLFWGSFIIRLLAMFVLLAISYQTWNKFYYVGAMDEMVYFRVANEAVNVRIQDGLWQAYQHILASFKLEISDTGFSTFLMLIVSIVGQAPILIKILLCAMGSYVVMRGYHLASLVFEQPAARLAGVFLMLYPISWFYSAVMLKEGIMVLMITEAMILTIKLQKSFSFIRLIKVVILIILLFFFRSAISILLMLVLFFSFFMQYKRKNYVLNIFAALIIITLYVYFLKSTGRYDEYYNQYTNIDEFSQERLSYVERINPFVAVVSSPAFAALSYISPFPSVVSVPNAQGLPHSEYYYHIAGNLFWIILAFFSFYGLYYSIMYKRQQMATLIAFIVGYQFVLLKAMMFTSVRFSYPAKPFLLIMAAYGIYQIKSKKWYPLYLAAALIMIVGWNYVRLKGRG
jgi:hypothetical protein